MNENDVKKMVNDVLKEKSWKKSIITGIILLGVLVLLDSFLFAIILSLLKLGLFIGGVVCLIRAAWVGYPLVVDEYKKNSRS